MDVLLNILNIITIWFDDSTWWLNVLVSLPFTFIALWILFRVLFARMYNRITNLRRNIILYTLAEDESTCTSPKIVLENNKFNVSCIGKNFQTFSAFNLNKIGAIGIIHPGYKTIKNNDDPKKVIIDEIDKKEKDEKLQKVIKKAEEHGIAVVIYAPFGSSISTKAVNDYIYAELTNSHIRFITTIINSLSLSMKGA